MSYSLIFTTPYHNNVIAGNFTCRTICAHTCTRARAHAHTHTHEPKHKHSSWCHHSCSTRLITPQWHGRVSTSDHRRTALRASLRKRQCTKAQECTRKRRFLTQLSICMHYSCQRNEGIPRYPIPPCPFMWHSKAALSSLGLLRCHHL